MAIYAHVPPSESDAMDPAYADRLMKAIGDELEEKAKSDNDAREQEFKSLAKLFESSTESIVKAIGQQSQALAKMMSRG